MLRSAAREGQAQAYCTCRAATVKRGRRGLDLRVRRIERHVADAEFGPLVALPAIERQAARRMQGAPAVFQQGLAERLPRSAERDGLDARAVARSEPRTNVTLPHLLGVDDDVGR